MSSLIQAQTTNIQIWIHHKNTEWSTYKLSTYSFNTVIRLSDLSGLGFSTSIKLSWMKFILKLVFDIPPMSTTMIIANTVSSLCFWLFWVPKQFPEFIANTLTQRENTWKKKHFLCILNEIYAYKRCNSSHNKNGWNSHKLVLIVGSVNLMKKTTEFGFCFNFSFVCLRSSIIIEKDIWVS